MVAGRNGIRPTVTKVRCAIPGELYSQSSDRKSVFLQRFTEKLFTRLVLTLRCQGGNNDGMPREEWALIHDVERRLADKYTTVSLDHVAAVVQRAYARFHSSRVRDFVPLLVERRADEELEELSVLRPDLAAVAFGDLGVAGSTTVSV
jgi:hypothetical protein